MITELGVSSGFLLVADRIHDSRQPGAGQDWHSGAGDPPSPIPPRGIEPSHPRAEFLHDRSVSDDFLSYKEEDGT